VVPELGAGAAPIHGATILIDDSASRALGWDRTVDELGAMIGALATEQGDPRITVAAFDQEVAPIFEGRASKWDGADKLRAPGALGASDLAGALAWAKAHGARDRDRVIVISDGVATAGDDPASAAAALGVRVDVVLSGGIRDAQAARAIAKGGAVLELGD